MNWSNQETLKVASVFRKEFGRRAVESDLKGKLESRDRVLDDWFHGVQLPLENTDKVEFVPAVVCRDTSGLLLQVASMRQTDLRPARVKVGLDRGGDSLKITANVIQRCDVNNNVANSSSTFRDTGVKRLLLLALAPRALESWANMKQLLQQLHLEDVGGGGALLHRGHEDGQHPLRTSGKF